jgi:hypothetical protein
MSKEGLVAVVATFLAFGAISVALYLLVLRPLNETTAAGTEPGEASRNINQPLLGHPAAADAPVVAAAAAIITARQGTSTGGNIDKVLSKCATFPVHVADHQKTNSATSSLLSDGLVAFRHTQAASIEQTKPGGSSSDIAARNRKERARILSKIMSLETDGTADATSFSRGGTIVVAVPLEEVTCGKLRHVLYLFATYYNLLVILVVPSGTSSNVLESATELLRGNEGNADHLDTTILPSHRVMAASSTTGRIAVVRQLSRVSLVLDFSSSVKSELSRFGFRVINYSQKTKSDSFTSQLGSQLCS